MRITFQSIFIFFAFFPQLHLGLHFLDSTPFALLFGLVFLTNQKIKIPKHFALFLLIGISYILMSNLFVRQYLSAELLIRQLISFVNVFTCAYIFTTLDLRNICFRKNILTVAYVYFIGVLLQALGFSLELISHNRTGGGRGFTSFASEATFLGLFALVIIIYFLELLKDKYNDHTHCLHGVLVSSLILLASSSTMAVLLLVIYISLRWLSLKALLVSTALGTSIISFLHYIGVLENLRIFKLFQFILENPSITKLILSDGSISERLSAVTFPYLGLIENYFSPGGSNTYETMSTAFRSQSDLFWWGSSSKIMNFFGTFIYELGAPFLFIFGIMFLYYFVLSLKYKNFLLFLFMLVMYNTGLPPMSAIFTFFLVFLLQQIKRKPLDIM